MHPYEKVRIQLLFLLTLPICTDYINLLNNVHDVSAFPEVKVSLAIALDILKARWRHDTGLHNQQKQ